MNPAQGKLQSVAQSLVLNETSKGEIFFDGKQINGKKSRKESSEIIRKIQMIFQDPAASLNERATVDYIISEGLYNYHLFENEEERIQKVKNIIHEVGLLSEHLTRYPHEFSGGQRQRIGIARALVMQPDFVIADEPISALDVSVRAQVLNLLKKFQKELVNLSIHRSRFVSGTLHFGSYRSYL